MDGSTIAISEFGVRAPISPLSTFKFSHRTQITAAKRIKKLVKKKKIIKKKNNNRERVQARDLRPKINFSQ